METSLRLLRIIWGSLIIAILLYVCIGELVAKNHRVVDPVLYRAMSVVAVVEVIAIFAVRRVIVARALDALAADTENKGALMRWRAGLIITFALCLAVALLGLVLRILGASSSQATPFYLAGALLMLYFVPRRPASKELGASATTMGG